MAKIVTVPDPRLRQKSTPVEQLDKKAVKLIKDLKGTLNNHSDPEGVGLSAPQIGVNKRVFIIRSVIPDKDASSKDPESRQNTALSSDVSGSRVRARDDKTVVIINPEILAYSPDTNWDHLAPEDHYYEGCLSIPGVYGEVRRPWSVEVRYQTTPPSSIVNTNLTGYDAIYFQHEFDHLEGILFVDRALEQGGKLFRQKPNGEFTEINDQ
jgi:peptide deformylase